MRGAVLLDPTTGRPESGLYRPRLAGPARELDPDALNDAWNGGLLELADGVLVPRVGGGTVPPSEQLATLAETTTTADPGAAGTSLAVTSRSTPFPQSGQFRVLVQNSETDKTNREIMIVTGGFGSGAGSWTVTRGQEGPAGVAHPIGSYVAQVLTAGGLAAYLARVPDASDHGLIAWSADPGTCFDSSTATLVSGTLQLVKIMLPIPVTISNVLYAVSVAGATLTAGQCFVGLYDSTGARQALSADQAAAWTSTGLKTTAMTAAWTPATTGPGAFCWVVFLAVGTTPPRFAVVGNTANAGALAAINAGTTTTNVRFGRNVGGQTALPATITLASNVNSGVSIWAALS